MRRETSRMLRAPITMPVSEEEQIRELNRLLQRGAPALLSADGKERIELPETVYGLLKDIVRDMHRGRAIRVVPEKQYLTTQRAADLLGVSRPHFIGLLKDGVLPYHTVGSHRRVYLTDVLAYARRRDAERHEALNALAREAFDAGLYDNTGIPEDGSDE